MVPINAGGLHNPGNNAPRVATLHTCQLLQHNALAARLCAGHAMGYSCLGSVTQQPFTSV